jgi:hypothetical protein
MEITKGLLPETEQIMEEHSYDKAIILADLIDNFALKVWKVPGWIMKRPFLLYLYSKINRFNITQWGNKMTFYIGEREVGELDISNYK